MPTFEPILVDKFPEDVRLLMEKELLSAAREFREPNPLAWGAIPKQQPEANRSGSDAEDIFSPNDLTLDMLPEGREYRVPGTKKKLYIFGITSADTEMMLAWSLETELLQPDPLNPLAARLAQAKYLQDLKLSQVALCCRKGPHRDSPRIFGREDLPALRSRLGSSVVEEIVRISSDLSGSEEALGGSVRRFFGVIRTCLQTSLSASATSDAFPPGSRDTLTRLLSLVTRALSQGKLDAGVMSDLEDVEALG